MRELLPKHPSFGDVFGPWLVYLALFVGMGIAADALWGSADDIDLVVGVALLLLLAYVFGAFVAHGEAQTIVERRVTYGLMTDHAQERAGWAERERRLQRTIEAKEDAIETLREMRDRAERERP